MPPLGSRLVKRQVRFAGVPDIDSDSTTSDTTDDVAQIFPDLFVEQTSLDPAFRREIEQDPDDGSSNGSYWDFRDTFRIVDSAHAGAAVDLSSDDDVVNVAQGSGQMPPGFSTPVQTPHDDHDDGYDSEYT